MRLPGFFDLIGLSHYTTNYAEKVISTVGGFLGIFGILLISQWLLHINLRRKVRAHRAAPLSVLILIQSLVSFSPQ